MKMKENICKYKYIKYEYKHLGAALGQGAGLDCHAGCHPRAWCPGPHGAPGVTPGATASLFVAPRRPLFVPNQTAKPTTMFCVGFIAFATISCGNPYQLRIL